MNTPNDIKYLASHQWARQNDDGTVTVGITDYAQDQLGDVIFVDLPAVGSQLEHAGEAGVIESVKTASDLFAPVAGEVVEINPRLEETPEIVNDDVYGAGWLFRVKPVSVETDWAQLLDAEGYQAAVAAEQDD